MRSKPVVKPKVFGEKADLATNFDIVERRTENLRMAAGGFHEPEQHFDGSALAGTVGTEKSEDFAATDLERKAAYGNFGAELFAEVGGFDGQAFGRRQRVLP